MSQLILSPDEPKVAKTKQMLSRVEEEGLIKYKINFSSLSIMQQCMRKSYYYFVKELRHANESEATVFGSAIHKALEYWYCLPPEQRSLSESAIKKAKSFALSTPPEEEQEEGALEAIRQFCVAAQPLASLTDADKRHPSNGVKILCAYFKHWADDRFCILRDANGPIIERTIEFLLPEISLPGIEVTYFGTIDCVLENIDTKQIVVADHKTTSQLGANFFNRISPNHQYTGYVLAAQRVLGLQTSSFLVNALQVAKTKCEFARQATERTQEDFEELFAAIRKAVLNYEESLASGKWPMSTPEPCSSYGGCSYLELCSVPAFLRESIESYRAMQTNQKIGETNAKN